MKLPLFADDMILYIENPKDSTTKKKPVRLSKFSKVAGHEINIQKSTAFLLPNNIQSEKEIRLIIPFKIVAKIIKYLGINLTMEVKNLYTGNYKEIGKKKKKSRLLD